MTSAISELIALERHILGVLMLHGTKDLLDELSPLMSDFEFIVDTHRQIFDACKRSIGEYGYCNPVTVVSLVDTKAARAVQSIAETTLSLDGTGVDLEQLSKLIARHKKLFLVKRVYEDFDRFIKSAHNEPVDEFLLRISKTIEYATSEPADVDYIDELKSILSIDEPKTIIGIPEIDIRLHPVLPGDLVVLAGRTSIGKTALALQMAVNCAMRFERVLFVSLEMTRPQLLIRILSHIGNLPVGQIFRWHGTFVDRFGSEGVELTKLGKQFVLAFKVFRQLPFRIIDGTRIADAFSVARLAQEILAFKPDWVFIDYIHLMEMPTSDETISPAAINALVRELKGLALKYQTRIVALSQINRQAERDKVSLENLYYSSGIAHTASQVIIIRERKESDRQESIRELEISIEKNRNGMTGSAVVKFVRPVMRFVSASLE